MKKKPKSKIREYKDIAVRLVNVSKRYTIHHEKPTLIEHLIHAKNGEFWALKNIKLEISKGENLCIIGPNGSGKTTLLKIIAGIANPTSGKVKVNGKIVSLIDLEAGFHPELSGIDNIFLNGMLLGMSKSQIKSKINKISNFADIGQFIDAPLFMYSSGMKLRLGFSVAVHANPDVLILDENIAVGDQDLEEKSFEKIKEFYQSGKTVISVTHILAFIKRYCKRVIWLEKGKVKEDGMAKQVIDMYERYTRHNY